jgi:hypothetical protein
MVSSLRVGAESQQPAAEPSPLSSAKLGYRTLGKTGMKVTTVGFGCMLTSDPSVIERAADLGINYFDTARVYQHGNNERLVGVGLKRKRKEVFLSTKTDGTTTESALEDVDTSLRELGTDYLDVWYLHGKNRPEQVTDELLEAQQRAKRQGKTRFVGVSTHAPKEMIPWLVQKGATDVVIAIYNFTRDPGVDPVLEEASKAGMGLIAMKVMAGGFRRVRPSDPLYAKLQRQGALLAALKWVVKNPHIHSTIPSMTDTAQLDENLRAMAELYTPEEEKLLAQHLEYITPFYCRTCGKCEGSCAKSLPVADMLRILTYADGYGQFALGRERFQELPAEVSGVRCQDCSACTVRCPYGVQVASQLSRAQELFA